MRTLAKISCVLAAAVTTHNAMADSRLNDRVSAYLTEREKEFDQISEDRKNDLQKIADYVRNCREQKRPARLLFVCTHNSRRSQFCQVWGAIAASYYELPKISTYSGGTEATAFNARAVAALARTGLGVQKTSDDDNPIYHVRYCDEGPALTSFSKVFSNAPNPKKDFCAVMVCTQADKSCPPLDGVSMRIAIPYDDPMQSDDSPAEKETYDERCRQIAREMLYAMSLLKSTSPAN